MPPARSTTRPARPQSDGCRSPGKSCAARRCIHLHTTGGSMKLVRFGDPGRERPGVLLPDYEAIADVSFLVEDYDQRFFREDGLARMRSIALEGLPTWAVGDVRLGPPIARPEKIVCIGLNYADHAEEAGFPIPNEPTVFFKAPNTIIGP